MPAAFSSRLVAVIVDTILLTAAAVIYTYLAVVVMVNVVINVTGNTTIDNVPVPQIVLVVVITDLIFVWLYSAVLESSAWQATLGKRVARLEVTDLLGRPVSFSRASARHAAKMLTFLTLYAGFLTIVLTEKRQALHDLVAGTLVMERRRPFEEVRPRVADAFDPAEIQRALDGAYMLSEGRLPPELHAKVAEIRLEILELLPHTRSFPVGSRDLFVLQRVATDYLPTSIESYLALPQNYATTGVLPGGKTALQVLSDQLDLLDGKMDEIGDTVRQQDSERLLVHGRFLEEFFGRRSEDLRLPSNRP